MGNENSYIVSNPLKMTVTDYTGKILRERSGSYSAYGMLTSLTHHNLDNSALDLITYFTYDPTYGNMQTVRQNSYTVTYGYDGLMHAYMTNVSDSGNYTSSAAYDYKYGVNTVSTDTSGNTMTNIYDSFGRLSKVFSPYDNPGGTSAIEFQYIINEFPRRAITRNKIHFASGDPETLDTVIVTDGLGRVLQTKKEGEIVINNVKTYGMNVSGVVVYDEMGRVIKQGQPLFQTDNVISNLYNYWTGASLLNETTNTFDDMGRVTKVELPYDKSKPETASTIRTFYSIENGYFKTRVVDPMTKEKIS
jgi:hypothetical protein